MIDLLVVGGGPAGLVTALHAVRRGLHTVVLEPRVGPIDKACGEGLMPGAVSALESLDVHVAGRPFVGITYLDGSRRADACLPNRPGLGVRRTTLHAGLHEAAVAAGVEFVRTKVSSIDQSEADVTAAGLRARALVGADGLHSSVRQAAGLAAPAHRGRPRWGIRSHYAVAPWTDCVEVHWAADAEAYVTPVGPHTVGVAVLGSGRGSFNDRLRAFPALAGRLSGAPGSRPLAAGPLRQRATRAVSGRVLLVGDAAGYVDALTGEGLALAFACAQAAVHRLVTGEFGRYEQDHARLTRSYRAITGALLWAGEHPVLRRNVVRVAAARPTLFGRAVAMLAGDTDPAGGGGRLR